MTPYAEVIGDPVAHSKSPLIHGFWLERLGLAGRYRKTRVTGATLVQHLAKRRADPAWRGCNVTVPHKQAVLSLVDRLDPAAAAIGAVNTIVPEDGMLVGHNTDGIGFLEPLAIPTPDAQGRTGIAVMIGAGGAARAIGHALVGRGVALEIVNRDLAKAAALAAELGGGTVAAALAERDHLVFERGPAGWLHLLVNATQLGMIGQPPLPLSLDHVSPGVTVYDIVYAPLETPLLADARRRGHPAVDGLAMLVGQAAAAFGMFFGLPAPREHDVELRSLLTA